jgi:hypothetical protein
MIRASSTVLAAQRRAHATRNFPGSSASSGPCIPFPMGLFVFLLGAVSSLVVVFILLVNFLNKTDEKIQQEYDEAKKALKEPDLQVFYPLPSSHHT